jgi:hypothetical protein
MANWIGHVFRWNCLPKHILEGKVEEGMEVTGIQGRRRMQPPEHLQEKEDTEN